MRLKDGDPFDIEGEDGEEITFVMTDGTVDEVVTNLDGVKEILKKGEKRTFNLQKNKQLKLVAIYVFKASSGEFYETHVTGKPGGDESVDKFQQIPKMADNDVIYRFNA
jgi:hypothetical protein